MRILGRTIGSRSEKGTGEIVTVAAEIKPFGFNAIEGRTSLLGQVEVPAVLPSAPFAGDLRFRNAHFLMNQGGELVGKILFIEFAIETV
jgi:hypothetical protein